MTLLEPDKMIKTKSILITGCSSGIGYYTAKQLSNTEFDVYATARKQEDVDRLNEQGLKALLLDLNNPDSISACLEQVLEKTQGRLFAVFNNGAYGQPGAVEDIPTSALRAQFETNLFGWHELTRQVLPVMRRQGEGRLIQNSSVLGLVAMKYRGAYNASKFALEGLTDTLRLELAGSGIHVSLIEPGPILSDFRKNALHAFRANIDIEASVHKMHYQQTLAKLSKEGPAAPFTLGPEAVYQPLLHALQSNHPKARYYVTKPTYLFALLRRLLPTSILDQILRRAS